MSRLPGLRHALAVLVLAAATLSLAWFVSAQAEDDFPHAEHVGLFPLCIGCHAGIPTGNRAEFYPEPAVCAGCHDGEQLRRVTWTVPTVWVTNLRFDHPTHQAEMVAHDGRQLDCSECHTRPGARRMEVEYAVVPRCLDCHAHAARDHYVDADCATCHVPLAETRFTAARVAAFPRPPSHDLPDFITEVHGQLAAREPLRCATCHTRELCASCHVNVAQVEEAATIPAAGAQLELPRFTARYPVPPSHLQPGWIENHGAAASVARCSTCHTRESCATCHAERLPRVVAQMPSGAQVVAPGVETALRAPESHASAFFITQHGAMAAARPQNCTQCHSPSRFCQRCHQPVAAGGGAPPRPQPTVAIAVAVQSAKADFVPFQPGIHSPVGRPPIWTLVSFVHDTIPAPRPDTLPSEAAAVRPPPRRPMRTAEFHPTNYIARHSAEAYARRLECSNCHNTRVFCRDCHEQVGFGTVGRLQPGFHDAEPLWLFRHPQAARQSLESCASCHRQLDCMQCHSQLGSFQVSPHGRGFDARRAQRRNPQICGACHLGDPLARRTP